MNPSHLTRFLFFGCGATCSGFTGNLTIIALLTYGGSLVSRGEISVGQLYVNFC